MAQRIRSQVNHKIREQTNELQQKLISQHLDHQNQMKKTREDHSTQLATAQRKIKSLQSQLALAEAMEARAHGEMKNMQVSLDSLICNDLRSHGPKGITTHWTIILA
eukprot:gnl/MRDRNA2_/MRDRNA2_196583_c0_seq1.p2 gnl/MRDRNA2_/MRDRNA2_196583_c0~~gnl/MRDRNA2_/MRDRNA2_196583_c0_seq1.p2  ORF type:complete len:107 (-),score=17.08 gnl/MRDRNA2_/MRDRNA2_196583_c0_seq1:142-462(-)